PWFTSTGGSRKADILINDEVKTEEYYYTNEYDVLGYDDIEITDDLLDVTVRRSGSSPDLQISWIIVTKNNDGDDGADGEDGTDGVVGTYGVVWIGGGDVIVVNVRDRESDGRDRQEGHHANEG